MFDKEEAENTEKPIPTEFILIFLMSFLILIEAIKGHAGKLGICSHSVYSFLWMHQIYKILSNLILKLSFLLSHRKQNQSGPVGKGLDIGWEHCDVAPDFLIDSFLC